MLPVLAMASLSTVEREKADYLYWKYRQVLFTCAMKIVKNSDLAEDVVQNAFVAVFQHLGAIKDCDSKSTANYLITAARHFAFQEYNTQKKAREKSVDSEGVLQGLAGDSDVWEDVKLRASVQELSEALKTLDEGHRFLLIGKYYYGFTYRELADMIKTSENGVSTRIVLAKRKLARMLAGEEVKGNETRE